jgi:hypothetical protein
MQFAYAHCGKPVMLISPYVVAFSGVKVVNVGKTAIVKTANRTILDEYFVGGRQPEIKRDRLCPGMKYYMLSYLSWLYKGPGRS